MSITLNLRFKTNFDGSLRRQTNTIYGWTPIETVSTSTVRAICVSDNENL